MTLDILLSFLADFEHAFSNCAHSTSQLTFTSSKSTMETLEKGLKYVQS